MSENIKKLGEVLYPGSSLAKGKSYHSFDGYAGKSHVGSVNQRVELILKHLNPQNLNGVDLGCSVGGISISLARKGASMTGYDHDPQAIAVANEYARQNESLKLNYQVTDINLHLISEIEADFVVWFSQWMWFCKQHGVDKGIDALAVIGNMNTKLFFETSLGDGMAGGVIKVAGIDEIRLVEILQDCFVNVQKIGVDENWRKRPVFMCTGRSFKGYQKNKIIRVGFNTVLKTQNQEGHDRESAALKKLNSVHFPKIIKTEGNTILMEWCGTELKKLPENYILQCDEIIEQLNRANMVHRDIIPRNLMIKDGIIKLIDFSWSGTPDEDIKKFPGRLGTDYRHYPGFNDTYSLKTCIDHFKLQQI